MTFCDKVHELLCQIKIDNNSKTRQLIDTILSLINSQSGSTFEIQKELSSMIYIAIQGYIKNDIKLGEGEMSEEQDNMLQAILPLIAYLNSPKNPWAHNGLFGNEITNAFHKDALAAYQSHESKETHYRYFSYHGYQYAYKPQTSPVEFNDEQIEILLDGKKTEKKNMGTAAKGFFGSLLTKGAAKDQKSHRIIPISPTP
jgi:hypothetical protein